MYEYCRPGHKVLKSGIYRVSHGTDCAIDHEVTCVLGRVFPSCSKCDDAQFSLVRYAADVEAHHLFRLELDRNPEHSLAARRHRQVWTDEELERMKALLAEGKTMREISDQLGRGEKAIRAYASRCGLLVPLHR